MSEINLKADAATALQGEAATSGNATPARAGSAKRAAKKKVKLKTRVNMWIRRIHLFSGLFMLPWVLLYGFTALLFNHPTYMTDWNTSIEHFSLDEQKVSALPSPEKLAALAVEAASDALEDQKIELSENPRARFTRQAFGSVQNDEANVSVVLDLNNGKGYLRKRSKEPEAETTDADAPEQKNVLDEGLTVSVTANPLESFKAGVDSLLESGNLDSEKLSVRSLPNIEFDAIVDGEPVRMRLAQDRSRGRGGSSSSSGGNAADDNEPQYKSKLSIVGRSPRDMSARSFLLRLHMAHGYGIEKNSRWFWAIAVDLMFASMVFWGLSGVVMWWQIKRTRRLGFILLAASAIVATWLAIGMHWQLVNG